ncbi:hypothetical protein [Streptomyces sp. BE303]|uniref:hypothetical protein n=1 Tax=Streptomyces sp. BE303 TaxID=3002528 RepID=UPI002E794934|nr:hypothetical protein [Streptomyces sp. BE303]MED7947546.1 hypothetical protein [Streptomyces sp. BE303]
MKIVALLTPFLTLASTPLAQATPPSDVPRAELRALVENVVQADGYRYQATDSAGRSMDAAKIIQDGTGGYLAVYHTMRADGRFHAAIATSTDLLNWTFTQDFGAGSSQPTISEVANGGYLVAWEQDPSNHIAVHYYTNRTNLLTASASRQFDAPRSLSPCAEGTPNIYSVTLNPDIDHSVIDIGGHYYANCKVDRQMRAKLTNFTSWSASTQSTFDNSLLHWGVQGNIGDRDYTSFKGFPFGLIEGQYENNRFESWRTFVYDYTTGNADRTDIHTHAGSVAFANPSITKVKTPAGADALLVSLFIPSEGAAGGEAGQLIYFRKY